MGHEGFTGTVLAALSHASADHGEVGAAAAGDQVRGRSRPDAPAPALPHLAGEEGRQPDARPRAAAVQQRSRDALRRAGRERRPLLPQRPGRRAGLREQGHAARWRSVFGDLPFHEGDYLVIHRGILHRWRLDLGGEQTKLLVMESRGHVRWPKRYRNEFGQLIEGAPYSERDIRRPDRAPDPRREGRLPDPGEAVRRAQRDHPRPPSVRRGRLGRLLLSLGLQHPRLRADRRPRAPAAAGAPDLPGRRVRGLQLLPAALRLPSRGGAGAVQPQQRGLRRGAVLRLERVHEPEGDRVRQHHPPSRRHSARPASRAAPRRASAPSTPRSWR